MNGAFILFDRTHDSIASHEEAMCHAIFEHGDFRCRTLRDWREFRSFAAPNDLKRPSGSASVHFVGGVLGGVLGGADATPEAMEPDGVSPGGGAGGARRRSSRTAVATMTTATRAPMRSHSHGGLELAEEVEAKLTGCVTLDPATDTVPFEGRAVYPGGAWTA